MLDGANMANRLNLHVRDELIQQYFKLGYNHAEILSCLLLLHDRELSLRQLKRILARRGLKRRQTFSDLRTVVVAIEQEQRGSGRDIGYRSVWQRLVTDHGLVVSKETVRHALRVLDPDGVERRLRHRLKRRQYKGRGPNFLWHIDGYDKLKPFGFSIHGCIDGYSRRIMWLEVGISNNDPTVVAHYFVKCITEVGGTARIVRADCGTENSHVAGIQRFLRNNSDDSFRAEKSFIYGRSVSNQRIEAWWSQLRRGCTDWWIEYFKELQESGCYCDSNVLHVECLRFCYMDLLRDELYRAARLWNNHRIRPSANHESPGGRPDLLFSLPETSGTTNFMIEVDEVDITVCQQLACENNSMQLLNCTPEFSDLANIIMHEKHWLMPNSPDEAKDLYNALIDHIEKL